MVIFRLSNYIIINPTFQIYASFFVMSNYNGDDALTLEIHLKIF